MSDTRATSSVARKAKALSLHIGLNAVSGAAYAGWEGSLAACEFDAHDMATIAQASGIKNSVLLTKKATRAKVLANLRSAAKALKAGDLFFLSYSGHGGQVPDVSSDEGSASQRTYLCFDRVSAPMSRMWAPAMSMRPRHFHLM